MNIVEKRRKEQKERKERDEKGEKRTSASSYVRLALPFRVCRLVSPRCSTPLRSSLFALAAQVASFSCFSAIPVLCVVSVCIFVGCGVISVIALLFMFVRIVFFVPSC